MMHTVESNSGNCLHNDGTSKHHKHFQNFQVATTNGSTLTLGLLEMAGSDADYTINALTKTLDWLDKKTLYEHDSLLKKASSNFNKMKDKFKQRHLELKFEMNERLIEKHKAKKTAENKAFFKKAKSVTELLELRTKVWLTSKEADDEYLLLGDTLKTKKILGAQLDFYRCVMEAKCEPKYFYKTKMLGGKRINFTYYELLSNLQSIIRTRSFPEPIERKISLKGRKERDILILKQKEELCEKLKNAKLSQLANQKKLNVLPNVLNDLNYLVGKFIQYKIMKVITKKYFWCTGKVLRINKLTPNLRKTLFDVV
ncbi:uncharacterized protein LOC136073002 [Hydra vulgaris]|uniref:uncharacterized protein LOC136073002 n=1 Tax=Hydra vulgaris TaxID=6087 RepID=UPI0032EA7328